MDIYICPKVPEPTNHDFSGTERQLDAIKRLFPQIDIELTDSQCNALLSYRDYGAAVVERLRITGMRETWIRIIATIVSWHEDIAQSVVKWSNDRFFDSRGEPRIRSTKFFDRICAECRAIEDDMARLYRLKSAKPPS